MAEERRRDVDCVCLLVTGGKQIVFIAFYVPTKTT